MTHETFVVGMVRSRAELVAPGDRNAADRAVTVAMRALEEGASASEACRMGRRFVESWARHPANRRQARTQIRIAS